jgi:hypothetical protein
MTLEQRIRAREEAERVANAKEIIASRQSSSVKQYAHLLPLADALNILLKRKNRPGAGAAHAGSMVRCTWRPMPLKDVCKQLSGRSSRGELNFRGMEMMNAKDVKSLIGEFVNAVPEWVHIVGGGGGASSKSKSNKGKGMQQKGVKMVVIQNGCELSHCKKLTLSKRGNRIPIPGNSFTNSDGIFHSLAHTGSNLKQDFHSVAVVMIRIMYAIKMVTKKGKQVQGFE